MRLITLFVIFFFWFPTLSFAQKSDLPSPMDSRGFPLDFGLGESFAGSQTVSVTAYNISQSFQVPSVAPNANRAYRHLYILNQSTTRTVTVAFGTSSSIESTDSMIIRPGYGLIFEPILFGKPLNREYIYFKVDSTGSAAVDFTVF